MSSFKFFFLWVAFCFAKNRLFRVTLSLHSFATLRNWLRQPLQSLPQFKIKKLEIEPNKNKNTINTILSLQKMIKCQNIENYFIRVFYEKHSKQMD